MNIERSINWLKKHPAVLLISVFLVVFSSIVTLVDGMQRLAVFYKLTLGHDAELDRQLNKLSVEVDIGYFENILGKPSIINKREVKVSYFSLKKNKGKTVIEKYKEYFFVDKRFYVQAVTDMNGKSVCILLHQEHLIIFQNLKRNFG